MKEKNKYYFSILISLVVLILIGISIAIGYIFVRKKPDKIFEEAIIQIADKMIESVEENMENIDFSKNDVSFEGKLKWDTSYNLGEMEDLKNYEYQIQTELSAPKEILKLNLGVKESSEELMNLQMIAQDGKEYWSIPDAFPDFLEDGTMEWSKLENLEKMKLSKEDTIAMIKALKEAAIDAIDFQKITVNNNVEKDYNGRVAQTTEYIYKFDRETQEYTLEKFINSLKEKEEFKASIKNILQINEEALVKYLESLVEKYEFQEEKELVITTTGAFHEVIKVELLGEESKFQYTDYNDIRSFQIDDLTIEITKNKKETTINWKNTKNSGTILYTKETKNKDKISGSLNIDLDFNGETINISCTGTLNLSANIEKEEIKNAKSTSDLTSEELLQIYTNLSTKLAGTPFEKWLENFPIETL